MKALAGHVIVSLLIALVFFTRLVDTGVNIGHEKTDGFLDSGCKNKQRSGERGGRGGGGGNRECRID